MVVAANLIENILRQRNMRSFAFDQQKRLPLPVENYDVGSLLGLVQQQPPFRPDQCFGVGVMRYQ